jgi:hypothetical protein
VDLSYQRPVNSHRVAILAENMDPDQLGVIDVSKRSDGRHYIIDGQHRVAAVRKAFNDDGQRVPCIVHEGLTVEEEANHFKRLNDKLTISRVQYFIAGIRSGSAIEVAINSIVQQFGWKIDRQKVDGTIPAVQALQVVYFGFAHGSSKQVPNKSLKPQPNLLKETLALITKTWGYSKDGVNGAVIEGVGRLLAARARAIKSDDLIHKLRQLPGGPGKLIADGKALAAILRCGVSYGVSEALVNIYNQGRRVGKIESLRGRS